MVRLIHFTADLVENRPLSLSLYIYNTPVSYTLFDQYI